MSKQRKPFNRPSEFVPKAEELQIENQEDRQEIVISTNQEILEGQIFRFIPNVVGVALESGNKVKVKLRRPKQEKLTEVKRINVLPYSNVPDIISAWDIEELGVLDAQCRLRSEIDKGQLGWTLSYKGFGENQPEIKILQFHDFFNRGTCYFKGTGEWKPGFYRLDIGLYDLQTMTPTTFRTKEWNLTQPASVIGCGEGYRKPLISFL